MPAKPGRPLNPETIAKRQRKQAIVDEVAEWVATKQMTRPNSCTPALIEEIAESVQLGVPPVVAAEGAGLHQNTFNMWMRKGELDFVDLQRTVYGELVYAVKKARFLHIRDTLAALESSGAGVWTKQGWKLERMYPEFFALRQQLDIDIHEHPPEVPPEPSTTYVSYIQRVRDRVAVALQSSAVDAEHRMVEEGDDQE